MQKHKLGNSNLEVSAIGLRTSNLSIKEIAQELGYSEQNALTRAFSRYSGMSPNEWKRKAHLP